MILDDTKKIKMKHHSFHQKKVHTLTIVYCSIATHIDSYPEKHNEESYIGSKSTLT